MATPRLTAVLVILMSLAGVVYGQAWEDGDLGAQNKYGPAGSFNSTMWVPDLTLNCGGVGLKILTSPAENYALEHVTACVNNSVPCCWVGVRDLARDLLDSLSANFIWVIPTVNFTVNQSCTLQFTNDGDLRLVISDLYSDQQGNDVHKFESGRVAWSSNTTGEGAVQVQLQNTGNLVLVNKDGKSVVWTSSTVPLLPLEPLPYEPLNDFVLLLTSIGLQLFHGIFF